MRNASASDSFKTDLFLYLVLFYLKMLGVSDLKWGLLKNRFMASPSLVKLDAAVTYECNARCSHCGLWKSSPVDEMDLSEYESLFKGLEVPWIHLTGGEPFLRGDFPDLLCAAIDAVDGLSLLDTSTNGILTDRVLDVAGEIPSGGPRFEVGVSIDGVNEVHDKIRGGGVFERAYSTFRGLLELSRSTAGLGVHINYVVSPGNLGRLDEFLDFLVDDGVSPELVSVEVARKTVFFQNDDADLKMDFSAVNRDIEAYLSRIPLTGFLNARVLSRRIYLEMMREYLKSKKRCRCYAGCASVFLDPRGLVYPCSAWAGSVGSVRESSLMQVYNSEKMNSFRRENASCIKCLSGCEGVISLIQDFPFSLRYLI